MADLSQSATLMKALEGIYPQYKEKLVYDGALLAFPKYAYGSAMGYNTKILETIGVTPPATIEEYLQLCADWAEIYAGEYPEYNFMSYDISDMRMMMIGQIMSEYITYMDSIGEELLFDTPVFNGLMESLERLLPSLEIMNVENDSMGGVIMSYSSDDESKVLFDNIMVTPGNNTRFDGAKMHPLLLAVSPEAEPVLRVDMTVYFINPNTTNMELALSFLEYSATHMNRTLSITLNPDDNTPVESPYYAENLEYYQKYIEDVKKSLAEAPDEDKRFYEEELQNIDQYIAEMELWRWDVSPESIATYRELAPYIHTNGGSMSLFSTDNPDIMRVFSQYIQNQMTTKQFVAEFDRIVRMMRLEQQ